jgi:tight adherence protein C
VAVTFATALATLAGVVAAAGIVDLANARAGRTRRRWSLAALLARAGRRGAPAAPRDLQQRIEAAGLTTRAHDVMALKAGAAAAALLAAAPLSALAPGRLGTLLLLVAPVAAYIGPDLHLRRRARARRRAIERELPDVLDLLRVALAAGLPTTRALHEIGRRHPGVLAAELARAADETHLGLAREEVRRRLARRCPTDRVQPLVAALERADRHGAPPSDTLLSLARDARLDQARREQERAARAAPQIQLVAALLLVPSVFCLVAAALLPSVL